MKALTNRGDRLSQLEPFFTRQLAERAVKVNDVVIWDASAVLPNMEPDVLAQGLQLVAVPIIMGIEERLGALLLARFEPPFSPADVELLKTAESQIDSAVIQGYSYYDLQQRNKELETLYHVDRIRDLLLPFDEMLNAVLQELRAVIQAEMGFIMLYRHIEQRLELRASTHDDIFRMSPCYEVVDRVANEALQRAEMVCYNDVGEVLHSILCVPLILRDEIIGVLGVVNRYGPRGFRAEDRRLLRAIGSQMDTAIFESLERRRLRQVLGRSVDPQDMQRLLANPDVEFLKGERFPLGVLKAR